MSTPGCEALNTVLMRRELTGQASFEREPLWAGAADEALPVEAPPLPLLVELPPELPEGVLGLEAAGVDELVVAGAEAAIVAPALALLELEVIIGELPLVER